MKLKERFNSLEPGRKKVVIWSLVGMVVLLITISGYNSRSKKIQEVTANQGSKSIQLEPDLIQKTMLREQRRQLDELRKTVENIQKEQRHPQAVVDQKNKEDKEKLPEIPTAEQVAATKRSELPPPPQQERGKMQEWPLPLPNGNNGSTPPPPKEPPQMIGDITVLSNPAVATTENKDKKKGRTVYLPPSFMEAKLLTGFDASTSGKGRSNPEPLLLRIQTPAVLPNDIKAELEGCFVIAEAVGRLDKERADVRLVSLSCLSNEGKAVIDTPVKGFVTDSDSKVGLSGRVVSRMGAAAARAVVAGFFGGMGDMLKATATTQSVSPLGTTTSVDTSQIAKYSLGGGLSEGANSLHDFYLTLAKQATPIIEVGASKKITVIISEGKELEIRELENDEAL